MQVDVIIVSEGNAAGVAESLKWLGHQTFEGWRAVVVEGGLADATGEAVAAFNRDMKAERAVLAEPKGRGPGALRNAGLRAAAGDATVMLEAGDKVLRRGLERLVAAAELGGYGAAVGSVSVEVGGQRMGRTFAPPGSLVGLREMLDGFAPFSCGVLLSAKLHEGKRYGVNLASTSDLDLLLRIAEDSVRFRSCEAVVALRPRSALPGTGSPGGTLEDRASEIESVLRRSYRRAAAKGWDEEELSEQREAAAVARSAMVFATMAAFIDSEERLSQATELLSGRAYEGCVTAESAAWGAATALRLLDGFAATADGAAEKKWTRPLHRWWSRCISERWASRGFIEGALTDLAEELVPDETVAEHLIEQLGMPGDLVVTGAGPSAFAVGDVASMKGWNVKLIPTGLARAARALAGASGERFTVVGDDGGADERDPLVVSLEGEAEALEAFAGRPNVLRWSGARRELVERTAQRIRAAWPRRGESADLEI